VKGTDHADRQTALATKHFRYPRATTQDLLQVLARETLLLHAEFDSLNWIGWIHRVVLCLVGIDQRREDVEAISPRTSRLRAPKLFDFCERLLVILLTSKRS
jgi:hypothetical protein